MSPKSAGLAKKWGFTDALVYVEGIPVWKKEGNRTTPAVDFIKDGNIVLVDLRPQQAVSKGYIPKAYSIPFETLEDSESLFPTAYGAPIVFYSDNSDQVDEAREMLSDWGYKNVIGFYDGLKTWQDKGHEFHTGPALIASEDNPIYFKKLLGPGEISISDFEQSLQSKLIYVVDARTTEEFESGHFPGAVSIPLDVMQKRMKEIPKDKFVVIHCKTGGRGEIGYRMLKEAGYAVKFLNAECICDPTGEYEIW
ncbi:MAG: hypothetical protein KAI75_04515 [Desulfobulbaceae bacterium]|nr:hypothetical protein [Desulfobulbaceae bacterium]MCK5404466.1 hypothetical protein [Desulfobulbaceae bacterium]